MASASPRRSMLLEQINLKFEVMPSNVDEEIEPELCPQLVVQTLSRKKAFDVAQKLKDNSIVIGADTIVTIADVKDEFDKMGHNEISEGGISADKTEINKSSTYRILGKPKSEDEAYKMLMELKGKWHEVITGICIVDSGNMNYISDFERTLVKMRDYSEEEVRSYIKTGEPMDKAGSYGIQGIGAVLVESVQGCYYNVVGLPVAKLAIHLPKFGVKVL